MSVLQSMCRGLVLSGLLIVFLATSVQAAPPSFDLGAESATLSVTVVHAQNASSGVDPKLKSLGGYLTKSFASFKGFTHLGAHEAKLKLDAKTSTKLPDGKTLTLSFKGTTKKGFVKVYLEIDGLKTTVDVRDGGLFFQAGRVFKKGILVLAIGAETTRR